VTWYSGSSTLGSGRCHDGRQGGGGDGDDMAVGFWW
jgi:hypothetical protein